jgi:hypothetical protein
VAGILSRFALIGQAQDLPLQTQRVFRFNEIGYSLEFRVYNLEFAPVSFAVFLLFCAKPSGGD